MKVVLSVIALIFVWFVGMYVGDMLFYYRDSAPKVSQSDNSVVSVQQSEVEWRSVSHEHITVEAIVVSSENRASIERDIGYSVPILDDSQTVIVLLLDNHREDLGVYDYAVLSMLDDVPAITWVEFGNGMGGHHVSGVLVFGRNDDPSELVIRDLSVGEVRISLSSEL